MNILRQGYFREMPHGDESDPSIEDFIKEYEWLCDEDKIEFTDSVNKLKDSIA